ncbi:hypothetical protein FOZ63_012226, partial [Perkinsus olseni]
LLMMLNIMNPNLNSMNNTMFIRKRRGSLKREEAHMRRRGRNPLKQVNDGGIITGQHHRYGYTCSSSTRTLYRVRDGGSSSSMMLHDGRSRAMISNASGIIEVPITSTRSSVIMKHDNNNNSSSSSTGSSRHGDDEKGQEREEPLIRIERYYEDPTDDGVYIKPVAMMMSPSISDDNNNSTTTQPPPLPSSRPWL